METRVGPQTPYEVYCYSCRVTFPVGTRTCVHCGRPIGVPSFVESPLGRHAPPIAPGGQETAEAPDPLMSARRVGGVSLWVLLALGAALSRLCAGT
jgi:hypothetical protein